MSNQGVSPAPTAWPSTEIASSAPRVRQLASPGEGSLGSEISQNSDATLRTRGFRPLYTPAQRARRDSTRWTLVQGVLAPIQFVACLVSIALVLRFLVTGTGEFAATVSIVIKTGLLYAIMITGSIWEKVVFDKYLFAEPFFWEDAVSMVVIALHTAYLYALLSGSLSTRQQMFLALVAYVTYIINAAQFLLKLRAARLHDTNADTNGVQLRSAP